MRIARGPDPGPVSKYGKYKLDLQRVFRSRCAYCILHEDEMGGYDAMEIDHFRPKGQSEFKHLEKEWINLYYACRGCNNAKRDCWPSPEEEAMGFRFVDPCADDPDEHLRMTWLPGTDGHCRLQSMTQAGQYSIAKIRLNRKQLIDKRRQLIRQEQEVQKAMADSRRTIELLTDEMNKRGPTPELEESLRLMKNQHGRMSLQLEEVRSRRPFLMDGPSA